MYQQVIGHLCTVLRRSIFLRTAVFLIYVVKND